MVKPPCSSGSGPIAPVVVIGYGNPLRRDDAVGQCVAEAVAAWGRPGVCARAVHQLTPELAEVLADAGLAVFVDACPGREGETVHALPLQPAGTPAALCHTSQPATLLALAQALYGVCPPAWWVTVPAFNFEIGAGLSPASEQGVTAALSKIAFLVDRYYEGRADRCYSL